MATEALTLTREAGVELLVQKVPLTPYERSHSYDDEYDVECRIGEQIIQVSLETGETQAELVSWNAKRYPDPDCKLQYLDITDPETWNDILSEIQR